MSKQSVLKCDNCDYSVSIPHSEHPRHDTMKPYNLKLYLNSGTKVDVRKDLCKSCYDNANTTVGLLAETLKAI